MATRTTLNENDHIQFLLSCVRHSNNGQVDFDAVVKECQIISKGAAAKRLARLFKRFSTATGGGAQQPKPGTTGVTKTTNSATATQKSSGRSKGVKNGGDTAKESPTKPCTVIGGGISKRSASSGLAKGGRKDKAGFAAEDTAEVTGSDEDTMLDDPAIKTEESRGDEYYDALVDPAGFFESDA